MKILITGTCGFIGSNLAEHLLKIGIQVVGIDNFDPYYSIEIKKENLKRLKAYTNFEFFQVDIRKKEKLSFVFRNNFDSVVHLAARPGVRNSFKNPAIYNSINVLGTRNILKVMEKYPVGKFIFASSSSVYGNCTTPFREIEKNLNPLSEYGKTKLKGEKIVEKFHRRTSIPVVMLRFFSVFGPFGRPDMAPYIFVNKLYNNEPITIFGNGLSKRDWTYIDDIVRGITAAITNSFKFEIINLGNSKPISLNSFIATIEKISGKKFVKKYHNKLAYEPEITYAFTQKAQKKLRWKPKESFATGMGKFIDWYKKSQIIT